MEQRKISRERVIQYINEHRHEAFDLVRVCMGMRPGGTFLSFPGGEDAVVLRSTRDLMRDSLDYGALKIFLSRDDARKRHYQTVIPLIKSVKSPYLLPVYYYGDDFLMIEPDGSAVQLPVLAMAYAGRHPNTG